MRLSESKVVGGTTVTRTVECDDKTWQNFVHYYPEHLNWVGAFLRGEATPEQAPRGVRAYA